jgi:menaquinone-9 beta-reductase
VCGEFIPAEAARVLEDLGVWREFLRLNPARIRRCALHFGTRVKRWTLSEPAFGLSRFELDRLVLGHALSLGARITRGINFTVGQSPPHVPVIRANGRQGKAPRCGRLFGFKAHFEGPIDETVELHFSRFGYVGISPIENGLTNVCGIAAEDVLRRFNFRIDDFLRVEPAIADRLKALSRHMPWLTVSPLVFSPIGNRTVPLERDYPAGDALAFVDPFTGAGILNALLTGRRAGIAAARGTSSEEYLRACRKCLARPLTISRLFRLFVGAHLTDLAFLVPGSWLYRITRPQVIG